MKGLDIAAGGSEPGSFLAHFTVFATTMGVANRWGYLAGIGTLLLTTFWTWQFQIEGFAWAISSFFGAVLIYVGANLGGIQADGQGRLAWQSSTIGSHAMLWHNGMVGGSASFFGIVEECELGVVILTNTAKSVDATGVKILSKLVKLKQREHQTRNHT